MPASLPESLCDLLRERATRDPDRVAILAPGRLPLSYAQLLAAVEEAAGVLRRSGLSPDDRVALILPNGPETVVAFLAAASTAICTPLNPVYQAHEFDHYLGDLQPKLLIIKAGEASPARAIAARRGIEVLELQPQLEAPAGMFSLSMSGGAAAQPTADASAPGDRTCLLLHTSGTTSRPKMVPLTQANLCRSARNIAAALELSPDDRCLNVMPLFHVHGLIGATLASLAAGASVVCTPGFYARSFFDWLGEFRPTWYSAVPAIHAAVLVRAAQQEAGLRDHSLRFIRSCSAPLPRRLMADLERAFRVPVVEAYGMTEAAHQIACNPLPPRERKPGSVGLPSGTEVAVLDAQGAPVGPGRIGEIVIRGETVIAGYLNDPEANERGRIGDWLHTGDEGWLDPEGYLFIRGRTKEFINRGGVKISPHEIEEALLDHPEVAEAMAFALPDGRLGEEVGAAVVMRGPASATERQLRDAVARRLAAFKVPRRIFLVPEIAKGPTGKPQRIGMAARLGLAAIDAEASPALHPPFVAPRTPMEDLLATLWLRILGVERVGVHDDFFAIGGDSLTATQLVLAIEQVTGMKLSIGALFDAPTIERLALTLAEDDAATQRPRLVPVQPQGSKPPLFWLDLDARFRNLAHRLGTDRPFLSLLLSDTDRLPNAYRMADLARFHIETIRAVQPEGPYVLGGFCNAGLVAYEVAQQLVAQGDEVALLVLIDVENPDWLRQCSMREAVVLRSVGLAEKLRYHFTRLRRLAWSETPVYCLRRLQTIMLNARRRVWQLSHRLHLHFSLPLQANLREAETIVRVAGLNYRPRPYAGPVLLLRRGLRRHPDPRLGWGELLPDDTIVQEIAGDHWELFTEPLVGVMAEAIAAGLMNASRASARPIRVAKPRVADWATRAAGILVTLFQ